MRKTAALMSVGLAVLVSTCAGSQGAVPHDSRDAGAGSWMDNAVVVLVDAGATEGTDDSEYQPLEETVIDEELQSEAEELTAAELIQKARGLEESNLQDAVGLYIRAYNRTLEMDSTEAQDIAAKVMQRLPRLRCLRLRSIMGEVSADDSGLQELVDRMEEARRRQILQETPYGNMEASFGALASLCPMLAEKIGAGRSRYVPPTSVYEHLDDLAKKDLFPNKPEVVDVESLPVELSENQVAYELLDDNGVRHLFVFEKFQDSWFWQGYITDAPDMGGLKLGTTVAAVRYSAVPMVDTASGYFEFEKRNLDSYQEYRCRVDDSDIDLADAEIKKLHEAVWSAFHAQDLRGLDRASKAFLAAVPSVTMVEMTPEEQQWANASKDEPSLVEWVKGYNPYLAEPPLDQLDAEEAYRLRVIPSFSAPVVVRVQRSGGAATLIAKRMSGMGGYYYGRLCRRAERKLEQAEFESIRSCFARPAVWSAASDEMMDGSTWSVDAIIDNEYKAHSQWSPREGPLHECAMKLLKLSGFSERLIKEL